MEGSRSVQDAVQRYVAAVKDQSFPAIDLHCY
jgi:ketopantoate hydroxymethyltransferase